LWAACGREGRKGEKPRAGLPWEEKERGKERGEKGLAGLGPKEKRGRGRKKEEKLNAFEFKNKI
jgi:hypothetical protein